MLSWVDTRNHVLDRGPDSPWKGTILRGNDTPRHARRHSDVSCAKTAEPVEMPFWLWIRLGPRKHRLHGVKIPMQRGNFRGKYMSGHDRRHCRQLCKNGRRDRDAIWVADSGRPQEVCVTWGHIGATWRIRLNRPCAAAMRPYVKLL